MKKIKKVATALISTMAAMGIFAASASAHVTVMPQTSTTGAWETYTVKVPVEKDVATTKVSLKIPSGLELEQYQPVPGWTFSEQKDSAGKVTSITWTATGEGILPGQFQQFTFVAKNPSSGQKAAWDAYQYYKDGSIVEWTGEEGSKTPHAITEISAAPSSMKQMDMTKDEATANHNTQNTPMILSVIAMVISIASFAVALRRKK